MTAKKGIILTKKQAEISRQEKKTMTKTTHDALEKLMKIADTEENEEQIRELVCEILSKNRGEEIKSRCLQKLRALENEKCIRAKQCEYSYFDLSGLVRNLCICSDIILGQSGHTLHFEIEEMSLAACPQILINSLLNLLSNAAKFSEDKSITVRLTQTQRRALITVENRGELDFEKVTFKRGINAAANAARLHGGSLFLSRCGGFVTAAFSLSLFLRPTAKVQAPLFADLLTDEFSCVHVGLSDVSDYSSLFL